MIQIIGTKKCKLTQKALRFFRDRGIAIHFLDISLRPLSPGELDNCAQALGGISALIDKSGAHWKQRGMAYLEMDERQELLADMDLLITPIIRQGKLACIGDAEAAWKAMALSEKS